ncbi:MAG: ABC transporter ATP-binding protein/permease [Clostridia bacterium]|nr:ABC transporter ATP-binding protein/permease [Clostridia bacterium]
MLQLKNIKKDYVTSSEVVHALKGINISFRRSEFVSVLGPSGCGKTTLLNIVGGLDHYTDGDLVIGERSTKLYRDRDWDVYRNHRVGFIFQSYNLIPHQTVLGNVELALTIAGIEREERIARAKRALDRVGLSDQYYKKPNQLSGGQCQRVAIARALVNDPEILLADEPTGALDTVTSVQIMDLIKEISNERLVIMVTHNPELAEQYSSRIVRLLDGEIIEDTNPMSDEEVEAERVLVRLEEAEAEAKEAAELAEAEEKGEKRSKKKRKKKERAKMSFFTAFRLSAKNLFSKRGRTALVAFAGSIGIIGIAMVLAFSAGIKGYIASMQDDMLSGNPIKITQNTLDLSALTGLVNDTIDHLPGDKPADSIFVSSLVEYLVKTNEAFGSMMVSNEINENYIQFIEDMPKEYYNALMYDYGIGMLLNVFTDFRATTTSEPQHISLRYVTDIYKSVLKGTDYKNMASLVDFLAPTLEQAPNNPEYLLSQYDLLGNSQIADEAGEIMLVLNSEDELSDLLLARLGYFTQSEFLEIIDKATAEDENGYNKALYREYFTYDELLGKSLYLYPTDSVLKAETVTTTNPFKPEETTTRVEGSYTPSFDAVGDEALELKVVGILTPKDSISYGSLTSGIYYTEALTDYVLEINKDSEFIRDFITPDLESDTAFKSVTYSYDYLPYDAISDDEIVGEVANEPKGSALSGTAADLQRTLGGNALPNGVTIYPISFDDKDLVTDYLDRWNDEKLSIPVGEEELEGGSRKNVKYTDSIELVVNMINTMIDVVSYALIAFTSVSLVVSTVMIGIITYVSVVERIKEIGVIRSLGGRKKDVSYLFNAETFIIGSAAGLMGVGVTYLISIIVNLILEPLIGYANIAALPISNALLLIALSVALTLISGLIPASSAAKKDPVVALRTE